MRSKRVLGVAIIGAVCLIATGLHAEVWMFDFEPAGTTPAADFTHVDETTVYSAEQGYGIYTRPGFEGASTWARRRTWVAPYEEYKDFVAMGNGREFHVDVPNGDYYITTVSGDTDYWTVERIVVNTGSRSDAISAGDGVLYGCSMDGVVPEGAPVYLLQNTMGEPDIEQVAIPLSAWRFVDGGNQAKVLGYAQQSYDEDDKHSEFFQVDRATHTVTDGLVRVTNNWSSGNHLNVVIIEPVSGPATPGDADKNGVVDDADLSLLLANWDQDATGDPDGGWARGEFDGVAPVKDNDLSLLLANWTTSGAVPEPASALVMLLGFAAAWRRRRT